MNFANKMAPGISEDILRAGHESESLQVFERNVIENPKNTTLAIFKNCRPARTMAIIRKVQLIFAL